jgi:subfamily B ATP-binding cassette protein MsbA
MLVTYPALGLLAFLLRPRQTYQMGVEQTKQNENLHSIAVESLGGIREIKALWLGPMTEGLFHGTATALEGLDVFFARAAARFSLVYQLVVLVLMISMVYIASRWARLSLPSLLVFIVVLQRMTPRVHAFIDNRHLWLGYMNALEKVEGMIGETSRTRSRVVSGPEAFGRLERAVELRELTFRHEGRAEDALDRVSFSIPRGKTVAIVGPSGAGKSTLLDLLARFYDPSAGAILVDGRELREFDLASWRGALGLVSQDTFLFNDSIEANIRYGDPRASREAVVRAAERAYAHSFISELPEKYATVVGDKGVKLSGGQRQRIALARAMLREPQLLLLDEATSHLDSESEMYVQRAIREFQKSATVVIVAHRLSTVEQADSIVVLDGGRVVEQGWHAELLARQGRYAELYRRQFKEPAEARG